jgi:hypothetical protein
VADRGWQNMGGGTWVAGSSRSTYSSASGYVCSRQCKCRHERAAAVQSGFCACAPPAAAQRTSQRPGMSADAREAASITGHMNHGLRAAAVKRTSQRPGTSAADSASAGTRGNKQRRQQQAAQHGHREKQTAPLRFKQPQHIHLSTARYGLPLCTLVSTTLQLLMSAADSASAGTSERSSAVTAP